MYKGRFVLSLEITTQTEKKWNNWTLFKPKTDDKKQKRTRVTRQDKMTVRRMALMLKMFYFILFYTMLSVNCLDTFYM